MNLPGTASPWFEGFTKHVFKLGGKPVTIVVPESPRPGRCWAWKAEFLDAFPAADLALLRAGLYVVHIAFPGQFGSPAAMAKWDALHAELTRKHGFAAKPALTALSRGGLYAYAWAAANPGKVSCIYADAPVCDIRSWPGGKGKGVGSPEEWRKLFRALGFSNEAEALAYKGNPVDNLRPLADAGIPLLHVYGDADDVVPWDENTGVLADRYRALGGHIELIGKPGCGHHPHGLEDPAPIVEFIVRHI